MDMLAERWGTLSKTNEVIDKHIDMGDWAGVKEEWRLEIRGQMARGEHKRSERGTGALPGRDQWISQGGDQRIPRMGHGCPKQGDQRISHGGDQWIP